MEIISLSESTMILQTFGTSQQISDGNMWGSVTNAVSDVTRLISNRFINTTSFNVIVYVSKIMFNAKDVFGKFHNMSDEMKNILRRSGHKQYLSLLLRMLNKKIIVKQENSEVKQMQETEQEESEEQAQVMEKNGETIGRKSKNEIQIMKEKNTEEKEANVNFVLSPINGEASIEGKNKKKKKAKRKVSIPVGKFVKRKVRRSFSIAKSRLLKVKS